MKHTHKVLGLLVAICGIPTGLLHAQSSPVARFTTPFPFYVRNQEMPAGLYMVSELSINSHVLLIQSSDRSHSAYILYNPTQSLEPAAQGEARFRQYGDADYFSSLTIAGEDTGMEIPQSKAERRAAHAEKEEASIKSIPLQTIVPGF